MFKHYAILMLLVLLHSQDDRVADIDFRVEVSEVFKCTPRKAC